MSQAPHSDTDRLRTKATWSEVRSILRFLIDERLRVLAVVALTVGGAALTVLQPWPLKLIIDYALTKAPPPPILVDALTLFSASAEPMSVALLAVAGLVGIFVIGAALSYANQVQSALIGQRSAYRVACAIVEAAQRRSLLRQRRRSVAELLNTLTGDTWSIHTIFASGLIAPIQIVIGVIGIGTVALMLEPTMGLLILALTPLMAAANVMLARRLAVRTTQQRALQSRIWALTRGMLKHLRFVKAMQLEDRNMTRLETLHREAETNARAAAWLNQRREAVNVMAPVITVATVLFVGAHAVLDGSMLIGTLVLLIAYTRQLHGLFKSALQTYVRLRSASVNVARISDALREDDALPEAREPQTLPLSHGAGLSLRMDHVHFGYDNETRALRGVDIDVDAGERIAIIGPSGAGKSTLVSLLARFADADEGRVELGGVDVRDVALAELRTRFAFVLQDFLVFPGSVEENVRYGRPDATPAEVAAVVAAARLDTVVARLPDGMETRIGADGVNLSGGEQQRVAIARAMLRRADVVVLDEPLAAIDAQTREWLIDSWDRLFTGQTVVIISHDRSVRRLVDRLCHLRDGAVAMWEAGDRTAGAPGLAS